MTAKTSSTRGPVAVFWFRRDLRLEDNAALSAALAAGLPVLPLFIFDSKILGKLTDPADRRVEFILLSIKQIQSELAALGASLVVEHGEPLAVWKNILQTFEVRKVFFNRDYEPYAVERDTDVTKLVKSSGAEVIAHKDQIVFEKLEVGKEAGGSYTVFTPYSKKWKQLLAPKDLRAHSCGPLLQNFKRMSPRHIPSLDELGFKSRGLPFPDATLIKKTLANYEKTRNSLALPGTSRLGLHLRFGTVSVRSLVRAASKTSDVWLNELIWREFFMQILWNYPHSASGPFRPQYAKVQYLNGEKEFAAWCQGRTGYPLVDAGMRELNATGFMHNRARMVVASFLVKHLLIDWRWGEAYFAERLLDFELASNNGNWQWVAGCGCDAAPYFRIFNPIEQARKFDPEQEYVKSWIPELGTTSYPAPIIEHKFARERALRVYKKALYG